MKRAWGGLLLAACLAAGGCGGDDAAAPDGAPQPDAGPDATPPPDSSPAADTNPGAAIQIGATESTLWLPFTFSGQGRGDGLLEDFDFTNDVGTLQIDGTPMNAVVYDHPPPFPGYELYQILGVTPTNWYVVWLYCAGASVMALYWESLEQPLVFENGTGTCAGSADPQTVPVTFPSFGFDFPPLVQGFTITGAQATYDGTPGLLAEPTGTDVTFLPFGLVDCSTGCGGFGWYELHSVLWDEAAERAGFGIVYLQPPASGQPPVGIAYEIWLPDLYHDGTLRQLDATWTMP